MPVAIYISGPRIIRLSSIMTQDQAFQKRCWRKLARGTPHAVTQRPKTPLRLEFCDHKNRPALRGKTGHISSQGSIERLCRTS